jgi:DNA-binding response OmpR family regulator
MTTLCDLERTNADLRRRLDELERERDDARARVTELEVALFRPDFRIPPEWRLTRQEVTLFGALIASGDAVLTRAAMMSALYGSDDWATPKIVDVLMCKMRAKLKPHDIQVETVWGRGFRLSRQVRDRISAIGSACDAAVREASALYWNGRISRDELTRRLERARVAA